MKRDVAVIHSEQFCPESARTSRHENIQRTEGGSLGLEGLASQLFCLYVSVNHQQSPTKTYSVIIKTLTNDLHAKMIAISGGNTCSSPESARTSRHECIPRTDSGSRGLSEPVSKLFCSYVQVNH